jgi:hypothetical protein
MTTRSPIRVTICREHGLALLAAARGCGCSSEVEQLGFLADMLESMLYAPVQLLLGDDIERYCCVCSYLDPDEAIDNAVAGALALRERWGIARKLN